MMQIYLGLGKAQMEEGQRPAKRTPPHKRHPLDELKGNTYINQNFSFLILQLPQECLLYLRIHVIFFFLKLHPSKLAAK